MVAGAFPGYRPVHEDFLTRIVDVHWKKKPPLGWEVSWFLPWEPRTHDTGSTDFFCFPLDPWPPNANFAIHSLDAHCFWDHARPILVGKSTDLIVTGMPSSVGGRDDNHTAPGIFITSVEGSASVLAETMTLPVVALRMAGPGCYGFGEPGNPFVAFSSARGRAGTRTVEQVGVATIIATGITGIVPGKQIKKVFTQISMSRSFGGFVTVRFAEK